MRGKALLFIAGFIVAIVAQNSFAQCNKIDAVTTASFKITGGEACSTNANLNWSYTKTNGKMTIEWGTSTSYGTNKSVYESKPIKLTGLAPNTTYYYHVWGDYTKRGVPQVYEYTKSSFKTSGAATAANKPPKITSLPALICTTGQTMEYTITATDEDNDPITFLITKKPLWASFDSPKITLAPTSISTNDTITIIAADGKQSLDTMFLVITVIPKTSILTTPSAKNRSLHIGNKRFDISSLKNDHITVSLNTLKGANILTRNIFISGISSLLVQLPSSIAPGIYLVKIKSTNISIVRKINIHR